MWVNVYVSELTYMYVSKCVCEWTVSSSESQRGLFSNVDVLRPTVYHTSFFAPFYHGCRVEPYTAILRILEGPLQAQHFPYGWVAVIIESESESESEYHQLSQPLINESESESESESQSQSESEETLQFDF